MNIKSYFGKSLAGVGTFVSRYGLLAPNFSPLGTFGFFGGNIFLFAIVTIGFDVIKGGFYQGVLFTYAGFLAYFILGRVARKSVKLQATLLPLASFLFFIISNFGVFLNWYPRSFEGLILCYTLAFPFFISTLMGDMIFGYGYLIVKNVLMERLKLHKVLPQKIGMLFAK